MFFFSRVVIGVGVEDEDKKYIWMEDVEFVSIFIIYLVKSIVIYMIKRVLIIFGIFYLMFEILCGSYVFCVFFSVLFMRFMNVLGLFLYMFC